MWSMQALGRVGVGYTLVTGVCVCMCRRDRGGKERERELFGSKFDCLLADPFVVRGFVLTEQQTAEERKEKENKRVILFYTFCSLYFFK